MHAGPSKIAWYVSLPPYTIVLGFILKSLPALTVSYLFCVGLGTHLPLTLTQYSSPKIKYKYTQ